MIPRLETDRLILRGMHTGDFEIWAGFMADPEVMRYLSGPMTRTDAWRTIAMTLGHWELRGYGMWAVERKADGALIGRVGMLNPEGWTGLEVGWTLGRPYWGQGYATEAAAAAMRYAFLTQPVDRVVSNIDPEHLASQAVALRLGEKKGHTTELMVSGHSFTVDVWSISRADWLARG
jgi:RimJ/RimL family protein N-acetyltransferase